MRRKMKLIEKILAHVERDSSEGEVPIPEFKDYTERQVQYHIALCQEAGFLVAPEGAMNSGRIHFDVIHRLTWAGHEELDRLRRDG